MRTYKWNAAECRVRKRLLHGAIREKLKKLGGSTLVQVVNGIQLVDGKLDIVTFQLNTLNLDTEEPIKNLVWIEIGCPLYEKKPFYEQLTELGHINMDTFWKFIAVLWSK
ncbi:hypothetical protein KIN20_023253 [Parelaphostrongylus tenuis]|uniref:Uncharacterized protein n=1 Tax=Parelaphostrongylus tenuis TaxID=148309 RepID=A0AAD5MRH0_PARTN|nr:hypothetical protein KIN20_023253 [Parelaphostrongylus tenuis]